MLVMKPVNCDHNKVRSVTLAFLVGLLVLSSSVSYAQVSDVRVNRVLGTQAQMIDAGDYYINAAGEQVKFLRKKNLFAVKTRVSLQPAREAQLRGRLSTRAKSAANRVKRGQLGGFQLYRFEESVGTTNRRSATTLSERSLMQADASIEKVSPVFAIASGGRDILIDYSILLRFESELSNADIANWLTRQRLSVVTQLSSQSNTYRVSAENRVDDASSLFALVRSLSANADVVWAQPNFVSKPYKTNFTPTDPLFANQWHLSNTGYRGSRCDSDCDAVQGWDYNGSNRRGNGMVIAIIDDGVQTNHEDLAVWTNAGEVGGLVNVDDDGNGFVDDFEGWDFVDDTSTLLKDPNDIGLPCVGATDGDAAPPSGYSDGDNNPDPQPTVDCQTADGDDVEQDNHGTAVAGIAAAKALNGDGGVGVAFEAQVLAIRLISDFDSSPDTFCRRAAEAMAYAGRYADVINNSWGLEAPCQPLEDVIDEVIAGTTTTVMSDNDTPGDMGDDFSISIVPKRSGKGSPVVFASGNAASGWVKVSAEVSAGEHAYEWRFLGPAFSHLGDTAAELAEQSNTVFIDDITWPDGSVEDFETGAAALDEFTNDCVRSECTVDCLPEDGSTCTFWELNLPADNPFGSDFARSGNSIRVNADTAECSNSYLSIIKDGPAEEISFWVWVDADASVQDEKFEFLIDGEEVISWGDIARQINNQVGYPANLDSTIAVGASDAGDLSGMTAATLSAENRVFYSQYGNELDLVAPSSNQHLA
ncbi:MAG: S8 family serine peptidase, partial [Pseudomonadota bacterium]